MSSEASPNPLLFDHEKLKTFVANYQRNGRDLTLRRERHRVIWQLNKNFLFLQAHKQQLPSLVVTAVCHSSLIAIGILRKLLPQAPELMNLFHKFYPFTEGSLRQELQDLNQRVFFSAEGMSQTLQDWKRIYKWAKALGYLPVFEKNGRWGDEAEHSIHEWIDNILQDLHKVTSREIKVLKEIVSQMESETLMIRWGSPRRGIELNLLIMIKAELNLFREAMRKPLTPAQFLEWFKTYKRLCSLADHVKSEHLVNMLNDVEKELETLVPQIRIDGFVTLEHIKTLYDIADKKEYEGLYGFLQPYYSYFRALLFSQNNEPLYLIEQLLSSWHQLGEALSVPQTKESIRENKQKFFNLLELELGNNPLLIAKIKKIEKLIKLQNFLMGEYPLTYHASKKFSEMEDLARELNLPWAFEHLQEIKKNVGEIGFFHEKKPKIQKRFCFSPNIEENDSFSANTPIPCSSSSS